MYKHILVTIDNSDVSDRALEEAVNLAKDQQAALRIVYAVDEINADMNTEFVNPAEITDAWAKSGQEILDKAKGKALAAGVQAETRLIESEITELGVGIAEAIIEEAKSWPADLIVAGTHGRKGLNHLVFGSIAESILRISPVPILLVHTK